MQTETSFDEPISSGRFADPANTAGDFLSVAQAAGEGSDPSAVAAALDLVDEVLLALEADELERAEELAERLEGSTGREG